MTAVMKAGAVATLFAALLAAGCTKPAGQETASNGAANAGANSAASHYVETVAALPEGQRRGVLFRAIVDSGRDCQSIVDSRREADANGRAVWSARCDNGGAWLVALGDDGIAQVTGVGAAR